LPKIKSSQGYLDAKDGNVGAGNTRYAVFEPQAVGLLYGGVSNMILEPVERGIRLTHVMLLYAFMTQPTVSTMNTIMKISQ